jgi:ketosteroid isomerase-like protein
MSPREVVERWVERFNAADADGWADLYQRDAVNHQVTQAPVEGRDAIRAMFEREFASADMTCIVEAIHEAGDVLHWCSSNLCGNRQKTRTYRRKHRELP